MEAYFRVTQKQSGGGSGATITVSYDSSYYGKTITCSDGVTTYTATTTSSGSTTFNVNAEGTWTITCNGTSKTVNVVLDYSVSLTITKTITVYGAANDTISFTDAAGSKTVTTDSSGAGSVSITFSDGDAITFTSSVADDPSNVGVAYYSKSITLTAATTEIYVMPDNAIYWYGYNNGLEAVSTANGWSVSLSGSAFTAVSPTFDTYKVSMDSTTTASRVCGVGSSGELSDVSKYHLIADGITLQTNQCASFYACAGKTNAPSTSYGTVLVLEGKAHYDLTPTNPDSYGFFACFSRTGAKRTADLYALWYE